MGPFSANHWQIFAFVLFSCHFLFASAAGAQNSPPSAAEVAAYFEENGADVRRKLSAYTEHHRLALGVNQHSWKVTDLEWDVTGVAGDRILVEIDYWIGEHWEARAIKAIFELAWREGGPEFVGHRMEHEPTAAGVLPPPPGAGDTPLRSEEQVEAYLQEEEEAFRDRLTDYNRKQRFVVPPSDEWRVRAIDWKIAGLDGERVFLELYFDLKNYYQTNGQGLFELVWEGEDLIFVSHRKLPKRPATASGWLSQGGEDCIHNYYAPNPCLDAVRGWIDFARFHELPLDPDSAKIYQAYKQNSFQLGDRLMARARGLPDPTGESAFGLHAEVRAMNLTQYQRGSDRVGCDLNPFSPRPCPEILQIFEDFAERHDLPLDAATGTMLEAYAQGNFKKADVIYALGKGLDVPAYGYLTTVAGREVAALWPILLRLSGGKSGCYNPYMPEGDSYAPCPKMIPLWRDFAKRYQLEDTLEMARIFENYAKGEYRAGDQLLAQAKGVSLEQLLEASGVPTTKGLVIEVFPGLKRSFQKGRAGA